MIDMLSGIHFLLTYTCNFECDHCFLYCSPKSWGTFTIRQIKNVLDEAEKIGTIKTIYFEGGEPFLYYPIMIEGIKMAHDKGFDTGIVTNCYWALSEEDAVVWLKPLVDLNVRYISVSDDVFHHGEVKQNPAKKALAALSELGSKGIPLCIDSPSLDIENSNLMFKGRAVEKLINKIPKNKWRNWENLTKCPYEDLKNTGRIHVGADGSAQICQGISMGNFWKTPLSDLVKNYDVNSHPICGPLNKGGPTLLSKEYNFDHEEKYVDECHLCFEVRKALIEKFPEYLTPKQVYGIEDR